MKKVLYVEDEDALRNTIATVLTRAGFNVYSAENGQIALAWLMPFMDGYELAYEIRRLNLVPYVVMFTGQELEEEDLPAGVDAYINKRQGTEPLITLIRSR